MILAIRRWYWRTFRAPWGEVNPAYPPELARWPGEYVGEKR